MSNCFPHFYCDSCSNVIHRQSDQKLVWDAKSEEILRKISESLPDCSCGGHFAPGCGPKCLHCHSQIPIVKDAVEYLHHPNMIVLDGSVVFSDINEPYMVKIVE